jgi:hypothetical protein
MGEYQVRDNPRLNRKHFDRLGAGLGLNTKQVLGTFKRATKVVGEAPRNSNRTTPTTARESKLLVKHPTIPTHNTNNGEGHRATPTAQHQQRRGAPRKFQRTTPTTARGTAQLQPHNTNNGEGTAQLQPHNTNNGGDQIGV